MIQDLYKAKRSLELKWEQEHLIIIDILLKWSELMTKLKKSLQRSSWKKQQLLTDRITLKVLLHKFL